MKQSDLHRSIAKEPMNASRQAGWQSRLRSKPNPLTVRSFATILAVTSLLPIAELMTGCNSQSKSSPAGGIASQSPADGKQLESEAVYLKAIEQLAFATDTTNEDGWVAGGHSRVFKSDYGVVIPSVKAAFAVALQKMLDKTGQNLATDISTYVPYSRREAFARDWWTHSDYAKEFQAQPVKKQIAWCYESIWDGSELFWRVFESRHPGQVNSAAVMAHDKEQEMVFDYREDEKTPGSFSKRYAVWKENPAP